MTRDDTTHSNDVAMVATADRRCTGQCCQAFVVGDCLTHAELKAMHDEYLAGHDSGNQIELVYPMVISLGVRTVHPLTGKPISRPTEFFSCTHLSKSGDCEIYDDRPRMCRRYPLETVPSGQCEFPGCTLQCREQ